MNHFDHYQEALEKTFPSLTVFSDMDWQSVAQEYLVSHDHRPTDLEEYIFNFPTFLQEKSAAGDSPTYLFELAFVELIQNQILITDLEIPTTPGYHINPTLSFLNLEHDIPLMIDEATKGNVQLIIRPHILCLFRHPILGLNHTDISTPYLTVLQHLEDGPKRDASSFLPAELPFLQELVRLGLILKV